MTRPAITPLLLLSSAVFAACAVSGLPACAQTHKVDEPENVVRAVAVYEWTGSLDKPSASRLVPVSLFINGQFQEAGVYLARPVPFVLDTGFAYELDEAGVFRGTFDTLSAMHLSGSSDILDDPWIGNGRFVPPAPPAKVAPLRTIKNPVLVSSKPLDDDPSRPHLVNKSPAGAPAADKPAATPVHPSPDPSTVGTGAKPNPTPTSTSASSTDDTTGVDRPTLRRPAPPTKEEQKKAEAARKKASQSSVTGPDVSLNDDPDRPTLRHHGSHSGDAGPAELIGLPPDMHQLTAVSDAATRPEHNFARPWQDSNERAAVLRQLQAMAREQLAAYDQLNPLPQGADTTSITHAGPVSTATPGALVAPDSGPPKLQRGIPRAQANDHANDHPATAPPPSATVAQTAPHAASSPQPKPTTAAARRRAAAAKTAAAKAAAAKSAAATPPSQPLFDEDLRGYELAYEADPTFVYTAHTPGAGAGERFVTLVAQQDPITHQLQLAIHSVTDAAHLDRTPQMRPLDAVDADASNRASLLVELRNQNTRQFALYRVLSGRADRIFLSGTTR